MDSKNDRFSFLESTKFTILSSMTQMSVNLFVKMGSKKGKKLFLESKKRKCALQNDLKRKKNPKSVLRGFRWHAGNHADSCPAGLDQIRGGDLQLQTAFPGAHIDVGEAIACLMHENGEVLLET